MTVAVEVLHTPGCPSLEPMLERLRLATHQLVVTTEVGTHAEAAELGMAGSPTLLIDGVDPFRQGEQASLSCRVYRDELGQVVSSPTTDQLRAAIAAAETQSSATPAHGELLSAWRRRATPMSAEQRAIHQEVLRWCARAGAAPTIDDLRRSTGRTAHELRQLLLELHEIDAIRLDAQGRVAVAYPFSTTPTRHRVRIGDRVDVYAMCAIDALGMPAMLDEDAVIDTSDPHTGDRITVAVAGGRTVWSPDTAVAFIGATAGGGPSADCCCDYVNLFTNAQSASAWAAVHPDTPGEVLDQREAEQLGVRLFGELLAPSDARSRGC